ncbi:MAG: B12-binding domain-containing radical SAM protein [Eubacterium sp.]|nr:B12-binding domain-containing radical SAM protein [Eubacterium sp.]MCM1214881.1 B12-binding domain-containing radical SAM protein [Lachnospiraceae bacterium]MCM1303508.1 B12-binding domain-containing radical SAM protein [Butyrivibrio sp.]MCM1342728.1 B12-binding domain-containing radical SAM protein [Muribaculaceae bacterium]MCM1238957.1 B12-binding domain-containing radical SAM protein [Lachnospiraceae bacterium]
MKFLLAAINAKYIHSNPAIYSLRACAGEEMRQHIELAEYTINQPTQEILADLYRREPDVIGFSCYIWNWRHVQELLAELPKVLPDTGIWLGGPEVSFDADQLLKQFPCVTGIMVGEGEATFRELMAYYTWQGKEPFYLKDVRGLCLRSGYTKPQALTDLSTIPFLYEDLKPFANRIIYYETSRGCPYRCSYCLSSIDKAVRFRDINVVKGELQFFLDHKVKQVKFVDRTFNCKREHAMEVWRYIHENDNGVTNFHFEISADILREDEIALLNRLRPGLAQLEIGVQTINPDTLQAICRQMDIDRLEANVAAIRRGKNIHLHLDLIAGLPYEDYESFGRSFDRVYRMKPEQLQLGFLKVLKGSLMHEKAKEYGIFYLDGPPYEVIYTKWLSYEDVLRLKGIEEMVELYYNSNQFTHTLPVLETVFESPFAMFEALAGFYEEKGYFVNSPARAYRYQVLLAFAALYDGTREPVYRELLTYDMYLRENLKSRPDFMKDMIPYKERIRELTRQENRQRNLTHIEPFAYPVWDMEAVKAGKKNENDIFVTFHYAARNPLTHEASVEYVAVEK